jgi:ribosomal protein S27AE
MKRICAWCGRNVGESCPLCGCVILDWHRILFIGPWRFSCLKCGHSFKMGEGGETHTICSICLRTAALKAAVPRRTTC